MLKNEHVPAPKLEHVFCTERKFAADYFWRCNGIALMLELQGGVEGSARSGHNLLYGMRYSEMLGVSILLTAKANAEAERVTKMENEMTKQK